MVVFLRRKVLQHLWRRPLLKSIMMRFTLLMLSSTQCIAQARKS